MATCMTNWEDGESNRIVELSIDYRIDGGRVEIDAVTPVAIQFLDAESAEPVRRIGIHTEKARDFLVRAYEARVGSDALRSRLEDELLAPAA